MMTSRITKILSAFAWFLLVLELVAAPMPAYPEAIKQFTYADKLAHFALFGLLNYFIYLAWLKNDFSNRLSAGIFAFGFSSAFAFFTEYLQLHIPGRTSSLYDTAAGMAGIIFFSWLYISRTGPKKPKLLLHICCSGCGAYVAGELVKEFRASLYYFNPNISPKNEYMKRMEEAKKIADRYGLKLIAEPYDHKKWLKAVRGLEKEPERGKRCLVCYKIRLEAAARKAKKMKLDYFTSTLTVSPHKDAKAILEIGAGLEREYGVKFLARDFKKKDGYKKSCELSRELGLYRQNYCGCEFSRRKQGIAPEKT